MEPSVPVIIVAALSISICTLVTVLCVSIWYCRRKWMDRYRFTSIQDMNVCPSIMERLQDEMKSSNILLMQPSVHHQCCDRSNNHDIYYLDKVDYPPKYEFVTKNSLPYSLQMTTYEKMDETL